jgi:hypothetical protein
MSSDLRDSGTAFHPRMACTIPRCMSVLAMACALTMLLGCPSRKPEFANAAALANTQSPLAWTVIGAQATDHLSTASMDSREPAPGNQFVVLDVSVRNRDAGPQVLSEGKLIAMDESNLQTFDTPVTVLSDDYLSLQVLSPAQSLRGKIAYEVPEHLSGVLYWSPGNGSERILLNVAPSAGQRTLAQADTGDEAGSQDPRIDVARMQTPPPDVAEAKPAGTDASTAAVARTAPPRPNATRDFAAVSKPAPARRQIAVAPKRLEPAPDRSMTVASLHRPLPPKPVRAEPVPTSPMDADVVADEAPTLPASDASAQQAPRREVATLEMQPALLHPATAVMQSPTTALRPRVDRNEVRREACDGLVSRNDPAEKAGSLAFFAQSCRDYALPPSWRPLPARDGSLFARASALLSRLVVKPRVVRVSDCSVTTSQADRLVCADPSLSAMDHRLAQSVARARAHVDDPDALQRAQEQWRGQVRNSCDTTSCLQRAYGHRIAQLDALAPMRP